ncbi:MAG: peroxiredoxin [Mycobacteriales bacterium]|nr:peroxiredoxin [Frankia sp.]
MSVEVGAVAPDFALKDQNNQEVALADFRGSKNVVVVFYPYAFSGPCSTEMCAIRDELPQFQNDDVQTVAISVDTPFAHRVWAEREGFDFPLLADFWPHGAVAQAYGCFDETRGCATRGTFIIDRDGIVRYRVVNPIPTTRDHMEYLKVLAEL